MNIDISDRVAFLRKISLFIGLENEELEAIAAKFGESVYEPGEVVFKQDSKSESFLLIYRGKVRITRKEKGKERQLAILITKDYFGESGLTTRQRRSGTVTATADTTLLALERKEFEAIYKKYPQFRINLEVAVKSRKLARSARFKWLVEDEVIYFMARKHSIILVGKLILPLLTLSLPLLMLYGYYAMGPYLLFTIIGITSLLAAAGWIAWTVIDWGNDYYIVTNRRAVWLEKVIGFYDSRQETPLSMILSVDVGTNLPGRIFDYGDVAIRTFVGQITFHAVNHPKQARHTIEEYWERSKEQKADVEKNAMKNAIRKQLGLAVPPPPESDLPPPVKPTSLQKTAKGIMRYFSSSNLKLRYESENSVVYRKHWVVLFLRSWIPFTGAIVFQVFFVLRLLNIIFDPAIRVFSFVGGFSFDTLLAAYILAFLPFAAWAIYVIVDWSNDKYEVTNEQIIDTNKKPLGTEIRKVSELSNILGTSYERKGLLGNLFNFGTVHIQVGGSLLDFESVLDPATVQSDVDRRRMALANKREQDKVNAERDRMAGWLATYHRNARGFYDEQENRAN